MMDTMEYLYTRETLYVGYRLINGHYESLIEDERAISPKTNFPTS